MRNFDPKKSSRNCRQNISIHIIQCNFDRDNKEI